MKVNLLQNLIYVKKDIEIDPSSLRFYLPNEVFVRSVTKNSTGVAHVSDVFKVQILWVLYFPGGKYQHVCIDAIATEVEVT